MAAAAIGARKNMFEWSGILNGAVPAAAVTALGAWILRRLERSGDDRRARMDAQAAADRKKIETDVSWNTQLLLENEKLRNHQAERIAVLEHRAEESSTKIYELEAQLLNEKRTVDRLMTENDNLRTLNEELRGQVTRLVGELNEERARNREWEQKIVALQEHQKGN